VHRVADDAVGGERRTLINSAPRGYFFIFNLFKKIKNNTNKILFTAGNPFTHAIVPSAVDRLYHATARGALDLARWLALPTVFATHALARQAHAPTLPQRLSLPVDPAGCM
jgi:hypothetical protein